MFQYVDQNEFMGINSRLQWRFSPMSDVFLVFVDNYDVFNGLGNGGEVRTKIGQLLLRLIIGIRFLVCKRQEY